MQGSLQPFTVVGYLSLLATLILSGPGVTLVRADEVLSSQDPSLVSGPLPDAAFTLEGPTCNASSEPRPQVNVTDALEAIRAEMERAQAAGEVPPIVVLNNRGFNYGPGPASGTLAIQRELNLIGRERR